jgi:hypothetical protein
MRSVFLLVVLIGGLALAAGFLALGAFPPAPHPAQIQKVLPNDRFAPRGG